uniref:CLIP domain-containing serine protease n=1 Tax=Anopheles farauti TaxID=69004 RepID=A0A182R026_9DIPT
MALVVDAASSRTSQHDRTGRAAIGSAVSTKPEHYRASVLTKHTASFRKRWPPVGTREFHSSSDRKNRLEMSERRRQLLLVCVVLFSIGSAAALNPQDPCETPSGKSGKCIPLRSCYSVAKLLIKEEGMTADDRTYLKNSNCGQQGRSVLVCCPEENLRNRFGKVDFPPPGECGSTLEDRIFGGEVTSIYAYPWLARIRYFKGNNRYGFHCGGVLIHNQYVLTAAHCIEGVPSSWIVYQVRLGEFDTTTAIDCQNDDCADPVRDVLIEDQIVHPDYYKENGADYNDIALLQLAEKVEFTEFVRPICLPLTPQTRAVNHTGKYVSVAGWGQTETSSSSTKKLHLQVPVLTNEACAEAFSSVQLEIIPTQVCAGGEKGRDSCRGDSGGPLMRRGNGVTSSQYWYLIGLVSFGLEQCGTDGVPGVYTRLSEYMDWVMDTMS